MAKYTTHIKKNTGVTFIEIAGQVSLDEQLSFMKSREFGERTLRVVTDLRNASLSGMPRGVLAKLVRTSKPLSKSGIRAGYVFSRGADFTKGKLLLAQFEALGFDGQFQIFTEMEKAVAWVQK